MKAFLMYKDRDFDAERPLPDNAQVLTQDLELSTLFGAMGLEDPFMLGVARQAILSSMSNDVDTILYRQDVLKDCLKNPGVIKSIYALTLDSMAKEKKVHFGYFSKYPAAVLSRSIQVLQLFVGVLKELRGMAEEHEGKFESAGFAAFFSMLRKELDDGYFADIQAHLRTLKFRDGVLISAQLGDSNKGESYMLRAPWPDKRSWISRLLNRLLHRRPAYSYTIADRDENGARALSELQDRGINQVANSLAQSTDHILGFLCLLQSELAFYIACLNLHERLARKQEPMCFPVPAFKQARRYAFKGLYDVCLSLNTAQRVVGNDVQPKDTNFLVVTGANQGGKSTFLRSLGLSQLMMQSGMFVPAESYSANVCDGFFTHYKREEDTTMNSGKFDEELARMSDIVDALTPNALILFNESFAATNEREGSEIAGQIVTALLEKGVKIAFVTHMHEFAHGFYEKRIAAALFLRAERQDGGTRTFRLAEGEPLKTGYGEDLYREVFGSGAAVP